MPEPQLGPPIVSTWPYKMPDFAAWSLFFKTSRTKDRHRRTTHRRTPSLGGVTRPQPSALGESPRTRRALISPPTPAIQPSTLPRLAPSRGWTPPSDDASLLPFTDPVGPSGKRSSLRLSRRERGPDEHRKSCEAEGRGVCLSRLLGRHIAEERWARGPSRRPTVRDASSRWASFRSSAASEVQLHPLRPARVLPRHRPTLLMAPVSSSREGDSRLAPLCVPDIDRRRRSLLLRKRRESRSVQLREGPRPCRPGLTANRRRASKRHKRVRASPPSRIGREHCAGPAGNTFKELPVRHRR